MKHHAISGGGNIQLHLIETGNSRGRPILFIHGFSQCWRCWGRQLSSDLASDYRLIAMDLRGHGLSEKPRDAYSDSKLWADDVNACIHALKLDHPVLCGWSYGPLVMLDYIRHHGESDIGGMVFVGAITKLGSEEAASFLTPEILSLVPGLFSTETEQSRRSLASLTRLFFAREPSPDELAEMVEYNLSVPAYVRQGLFSRVLDNDDLLPKVRKPVLIVHGLHDAVVKPSIVERHRAALPHAKVELIPEAGHAVFWDDAARFNDTLRAFVADSTEAVAA